MKAIIRNVFGVTAVLIIMAAIAPASMAGITWVKGYDAGMRKAKSEGKPAMLDFTAKWCGWCVKLDKDTFTDPAVQRLAKSFVCVKVDLDKENAKAQEWSIRGIPHILFLDPDGKLIARLSGYKGPAPFALEMSKALAKHTPRPAQKPPERVKKPAAPPPPKSEATPIFVECSKCGNIFNSASPKGECPRCGAPYEVK